jgi:lipopolysaccharide biosynthesis regulator YciM
VAVVVLALSAPAECQTVSGLLQKGIYTEETVGDLDAAIKIYEQVVAEAEANRSHVAQAHYRLAMCYEKKGRKQEAATALQKLVEQFPKETEVVGQARAKLSALGQASSGVVARLVWADAGDFSGDLKAAMWE